MKKTFLAIILAGMACHAMAADSTDLTVKGVLVNAACTPTLDKNEVNFGHIPLSNLDATNANQLGSKDVTLTITCDSAMVMGWTTVDGRTDSLQTLSLTNAGADNSNVTDAANEYGLGKAGTVNIGAYSIAAKTSGVTYDGTAGDLLEVDNVGNGNTTAWKKSTTGVTKPGTRTFTAAVSGEVAPKAFKVGIFPLKVTAAVQDTKTLNIAEDTDLDGLATISLSYI
ncbi:DUF1120 domain-containing protein [Cronobacter turicensis]|uniref:DUF1120 domain-containing protein n=1 Tax=Cronobacter turicensis TaxID=413502 RepID=UPI001FD1B734|nr:DUF1120 domain-containing protein [Cronobacter turicensis]